MAKFGHGTPDDWLERNVYSKHSLWGVLTMLAIDVALFGAIGLTVWAVQMAWIPFWAAGVVNGIGHYWGYRNYNSPDTSTNVFPWGIVIGGEELHNNHHAHGTSAKFSAKWYEFDIGWCYINILKFLGLAKIKKVAPKLKLDDSRTGIDLRTLQGVITHRYEVMARYADIIKSAAREELAKMKASRRRQRRMRLEQAAQGAPRHSPQRGHPPARAAAGRRSGHRPEQVAVHAGADAPRAGPHLGKFQRQQRTAAP